MDAGFIGLGRTGAPKALNLIRAGHRVVVYDRMPLALPCVPMAVGPCLIGSDRHIPPHDHESILQAARGIFATKC